MKLRMNTSDDRAGLDLPDHDVPDGKPVDQDIETIDPERWCFSVKVLPFIMP